MFCSFALFAPNSHTWPLINATTGQKVCMRACISLAMMILFCNFQLHIIAANLMMNEILFAFLHNKLMRISSLHYLQKYLLYLILILLPEHFLL